MSSSTLSVPPSRSPAVDSDSEFDMDSDTEVSSPPPQRSKVSSLLSDFYGLSAGSGASSSSAPDSSADPDCSIAPVSSSSPLDLDSASFDSRDYTRRLFNQLTLKELIERDNELISSRRHYDSAMQQLVYENYNKFISATDIIRVMRQNVESMESSMSALQEKMKRIEHRTGEIEHQLAPNREKVENFLGVSRLLKRLEFLFELPRRLSSAIELGSFDQAVRYYQLSSAILHQYSHIPSFDGIRADSGAIIDGLKSQLRRLVRDPAASGEQQIHYTALLIGLNEPADELIRDLLTSKREKIKREIARAIESREKAALQNQSNSQEDFSAMLEQSLVTPLTLFASSFRSELGGRPASIDSLTDFSAPLIEDYFQLVKTEFKGKIEKLAAGFQIITNKETERADTGDAAEESDLDADVAFVSPVIASLLAGLSDFSSHVARLSSSVPLSSLRANYEATVLSVVTAAIEALLNGALSRIGRDIAQLEGQLALAVNQHKKYPQATHFSSLIRRRLESSLRALRPLIDSDTLEPLPALHERVHSALDAAFFQFLCDSLFGQQRKSLGPIFDSPIEAANPAFTGLARELASLKISRSPRSLPAFFALLCQIFLELESRDYPALCSTRDQLFPRPDRTRKPNQKQALIKENALAALQRFVHLRGAAITDKLRNLPNRGQSQSLVELFQTEIQQFNQDVKLAFAQESDARAESESAVNSSASAAHAAVDGSGAVSLTDAVNRDIAKLFAVKSSTFSAVKLARHDPLANFLKIALKGLVESLREHAPIDSQMAAEMEEQLIALRSALPIGPLPSEVASLLLAQLEEARHACREREKQKRAESSE